MFSRSKTKMKTISIVIPVYNVEPYITDCLQSVMRQTYQGSIECVLVDDCGNDNSMEVAEKLISEYKGPIEFKVLHNEHNRGLSAARNTGVVAAKGDYLYFLDSDDWISDDCIEKLAQPLQKEKFDVVVGDFEPVGEMPCRLELFLKEGPYHEKRIKSTFSNCGVYVMAVNKLYSKEFLLKNQLSFEEGKVYEDEIFAFELCCLKKNYYVVKAVTYYYRIRENSITTNMNQFNKLTGYVGVLRHIKEKVRWYGKEEGVYDYYMWWIKRLFAWVSQIEDNEGVLSCVQEQTKGYLEPVPGVPYLRNKHNRLIYYACKKEQTYLRYQYVTKEYATKLSGRIMRNVLNLLPNK